MNVKSGYIFGIAGYFWWGLFPLFFALLTPVNPFEIIPWRVFTAILFCVTAITIMRAWKPLGEVLRAPRMLAWFMLSALFLYANWTLFVMAIVSGQVIETALGYFITPLVTIVIGVVVRKERLNLLQWLAVMIAALGITVSTIAYGNVPWLALGIAVSFGLYGAVRKHASESIDALSSLTVETILVLPIAVVQIVLVAVFGGGLAGIVSGDLVLFALLASGAVTAIPLLLFGAANRRLPLTHLGFIQFLTPIMGFLLGVFFFGETMPVTRWIGFIAVWVALVLLVADMLLALRRAAVVRSRGAVAAVTGEIATVCVP